MVKLALFFFAVSLGMAQFNSDSITVTASHPPSLTPDQADFSISVQVPAGMSFNDVLAALQGSGLTAGSFSQVSNLNPTTPPTVTWTFDMLAPLADSASTTAMLTALQQTLAGKTPPLTLSFSIRGTQVSIQQQQSQTCSISALVANAQSQAQALAKTGNLAFNSIVAVSGTTSTPSNCTLVVKYANSVSRPPLFTKTESNTLAITASEQLNPQPDQVLFYIYVDASPSKSLNDILAALQGLGVTAGELFYTYPASNGNLQWQFSVPVPLTNLQTTEAALVALSSSAMPVTFFTVGLQTSPALVASETCPVASLISAAQTQAQAIATAAGISTGPILSLDTSGTNPVASSLVISPIGEEIIPGRPVNTIAPPSCSIVVTFQILPHYPQAEYRAPASLGASGSFSSLGAI